MTQAAAGGAQAAAAALRDARDARDLRDTATVQRLQARIPGCAVNGAWIAHGSDLGRENPLLVVNVLTRLRDLGIVDRVVVVADVAGGAAEMDAALLVLERVFPGRVVLSYTPVFFAFGV